MLLAVGLGLITSSVAAGVLTIWLLSIAAVGGLGNGTAGLIAAAVVWIGFWIGLSLGLAGGLMAGFRFWIALYPTAQRNAAAHQLRAEHRGAIAEAEAVLRAAEIANDSTPPHD